MAEYTPVFHNIPPLWAPDSRVLILGSFPSPKSRQQGFFYGHPRNRFWPVLAAVYGEAPPGTVEEKRALALRHHLALWDTVASCEIIGASDAAIRNPRPNDLMSIIRASQIHAVFCTGTAAFRLYEKLCLEDTGLPAHCLPSTSPANAAWSLEHLTEAYGVIAQASED